MVYTCAIQLIILLRISYLTGKDKVKSVLCFYPAMKSLIVIDIKGIQKETFHCGDPLSSDVREILTFKDGASLSYCADVLRISGG